MTSPSPLPAWLASDAFHSTDRHFADLMRRLAASDCSEQVLDWLTLAAALASRWLADGQSCLPLAAVADQPYPTTQAGGLAPVQCPPQAQWEELLRKTSVVGKPGEMKPLILDNSGRLYLQRYWRYEQAVADDLGYRLAQPPMDFDRAALASGLNRFFPARPAPAVNWQKVAAFAALRQRFCVITGGPGTGKTYTVARLLALLLEQSTRSPLRIRLAAPTGKAVARLQESLRNALETLDCSPAIKARLQDKDLTSTLHRLLGTIPNSVRFRHGADNLLPLDVLVVDEASMVSLSLMAKLLDALKPEARLILVGDKDQLPPVDPGGVLGDVCRASAINGFNPGFRDDFLGCSGEVIPEEPESGKGDLLDAVIQLRANRRAGEASFLHTVSVAINAGETACALNLIRNTGASASTVTWQELPQPRLLKGVLRQVVLHHYRPVLEAPSELDALIALDRFRVLCAVREGPYGSLALNRLIEQILHEAGLISADGLRLGNYPGKPVMITANHYVLKLFNGDIGVIGSVPNGSSSLVHFPKQDGGIRVIARERLPEYETVYAMTVHKSQGSEFAHVLLVLPDRENPVLTRELIYTGLTRAKQSIGILAKENIFRFALDSPSQRVSGLRDALAKGHDPNLSLTVGLLLGSDS